MPTTFRKYLELIRFSHTLFALPFAMLGMIMAIHENRTVLPFFPLRTLDFPGILICMVFARSAAMAFNRLVDRNIDAKNPRTAGRHLPTRQLGLQSVLVFVVLCSLGFIGGTALFLPRNPIPIITSVPVLLFLLGYSFAKRFTLLAHWWLGAALMLSPIAAWVAVRPVFSWAPVLLGLAVCFWTAGFDIIYALQDERFDREQKLFSIPAKWGIRNALRMAAVCHLMMIFFLVMLPFVYPEFGMIFQIGIGLIFIVLFMEHLLVRPDDPKRINLVFFWLNIFVSLAILLIGIIDIFY